IHDITEAADINRGTFYLHYEDKYDLLEKMEDEYANVLYDKTRIFESMKTIESIDKFYEVFSNQVLRNVITHVYNNLEFYQVILTIERQSQIEERISEMILENMKLRMNPKGDIAGIPVMYFHSYVSGSMLSVIKYWVQDEQRVDIDTLIQYISKIVFNGPLRLLATDQ
ncbi:TetR family transcriptional regulator, partial [Staphylococcus simulans]